MSNCGAGREDGRRRSDSLDKRVALEPGTGKYTEFPVLISKWNMNLVVWP